VDHITTDLKVEVGHELTIDLEAIPGAGYMWVNTQGPEELEVVSEKIVSISKEIGGNSVQRFVIHAHQAGRYTMVYELKRSWENQSVKTHIFTIEVN
jgi:predicted secreted protein